MASSCRTPVKDLSSPSTRCSARGAARDIFKSYVSTFSYWSKIIFCIISFIDQVKQEMAKQKVIPPKIKRLRPLLREIFRTDIIPWTVSVFQRKEILSSQTFLPLGGAGGLMASAGSRFSTFLHPK